MAIYAGIDCGTQGTKVLLIDTAKQQVLGEGRASHELISDANGRREQQPQWWIDALITAFHQALQSSAIKPEEIRGLAVSGQQHGLVVLDAEGNVLYPAKLWCDTETAPQNKWLLEQLGGRKGSIAKLGLAVLTSHTASKIIWLQQNHPDIWQKVETILLPHDYLNYWLTGQRVMEYGDASRTGLLNVRQRAWSKEVVNLIDNSGRLWQALPPLLSAHEPVGTVSAAAIKALGLTPDTFVASGGGDNMMGAIGTGNIKPGLLTMSLGTSGTLFAYAAQPMEGDSSQLEAFCSSNNGWLPLICTMNVTSTTSTVRKMLAQDLPGFNEALKQSQIGADGMIMLPFFNGERTPNLPDAKASLHYLDDSNFTQANLCRAAVEGATFGLRYGLDLFKQQGLAPDEIRLTGGGANSPLWRQIVADVMSCPVVVPREMEAAALGAAIQAAWCDALQQTDVPAEDSQKILSSLGQQFVSIDSSNRTLPDSHAVERYQQVYQRYLALLRQYYPEVA